MGYMRHKAYIFTDSDYRTNLWDLHEAIAADMAGVDVGEGIVTPIFVGVNGYASFAVLPDGSKEWRPTSDACDDVMERAIAWAQDKDIDFAAVQFYDEAGMVSLQTRYANLSCFEGEE